MIAEQLIARKLDAQVAPMIREIGQKFVMPIFKGEVDAEIVQKDDPATGPSPLTIADVGVQLLITREIEKIYDDEREKVFGEEYVPRFTHKQQSAIDKFDLEKGLSPDYDARAFIDLLKWIVKPDKYSPLKKLPQANLSTYRPHRGRRWIIDPIDGTIPFSKKLKGFSILLAQTIDARVTAGWMYRPAFDDMFRRIGPYGTSNYVTFTKKGVARIRSVKRPDPKPFSKMKIVYPHAHANVPLDDMTKRIYCNAKGERIPFADLRSRHAKTFKQVIGADGYSNYICKMLRNEVDAVCVPGSQPWDHFAPAFIAQRAGYSVSFFDGRPYLGPQGQITLSNADPSQIEDRGGVLYCAREIWDELNNELCEKWRRAPAKLPYVSAQL